jgi:hypothetical protein
VFIRGCAFEASAQAISQTRSITGFTKIFRSIGNFIMVPIILLFVIFLVVSARRFYQQRLDARRSCDRRVGEEVNIHIRDTGKGIPAEIKDKTFFCTDCSISRL